MKPGALPPLMKTGLLMLGSSVWSEIRPVTVKSISVGVIDPFAVRMAFRNEPVPESAKVVTLTVAVNAEGFRLLELLGKKSLTSRCISFGEFNLA